MLTGFSHIFFSRPQLNVVFSVPKNAILSVLQMSWLQIDDFLDFVGVPMQCVPAARIDRLTQKQTASHKYVARYPRQNLLETVHHKNISSINSWKTDYIIVGTKGRQSFSCFSERHWKSGNVECRILSKVFVQCIRLSV